MGNPVRWGWEKATRCCYLLRHSPRLVKGFIMPGRVSCWRPGVGEVVFLHGWWTSYPSVAVYYTPAGEIEHVVSPQVAQMILNSCPDWWAALRIIDDVEMAERVGAVKVISELPAD